MILVGWNEILSHFVWISAVLKILHKLYFARHDSSFVGQIPLQIIVHYLGK